MIVLGGGLAGIVAALDCADAGARVSLLEVRPRLGGAAYSFERDGLRLDNGQHVFLRCCTAYRALLERLGSSGRVNVQARLEIPVLSPGVKPAMLRRGRLPAPLHLAGALLRYPHLTLGQRLSAARAALALGRLDPRVALELERVAAAMPEQPPSGQREPSPAPGTLGDWLAEHGQGPESVAALWDLIALPTLNLPAAEGSLVLGAFVLRTGLLKRADAGDIGFHMRPLSETLGEPAERALAQAGVDVRLGVRAERVAQSEEGGLRVNANGAELRADAVVSAIPHQRAATLLEPLLGEQASSWTALGESPIVNVHVVYDRRVCELGFAAGVGTPVQYVFDRTDAAGLPRTGTHAGVRQAPTGSAWRSRCRAPSRTCDAPPRSCASATWALWRSCFRGRATRGCEACTSAASTRPHSARALERRCYVPPRARACPGSCSRARGRTLAGRRRSRVRCSAVTPRRARR